jgi:hypothetical protein
LSTLRYESEPGAMLLLRADGRSAVDGVEGYSQQVGRLIS